MCFNMVTATSPLVGCITVSWITILKHTRTISFLGIRPERPGLEMLGDILFRSRDGQNAAVQVCFNMVKQGRGWTHLPFQATVRTVYAVEVGL